MSRPAVNDSLAEHADWLRRLAASLVQDPDAAEDLAQETLIAASRQRQAKRELSRGWLRVVLLGLFKNHLRAEARRERRERAANDVESPAEERSPGELLETSTLLNRLVSELPQPYRSTIVATYFLGMSSSEVGKQQGVPASTVRARVTLALQMLRERLDEAHGNDRGLWKRALAPLVAVRALSVPAVGSVTSFTVSALGLATLVLIATAVVRPFQRSGDQVAPSSPAGTGAGVPPSAPARVGPRAEPKNEPRASDREDLRGNDPWRGLPPSPVLSFAAAATEGRCEPGGDLGEVNGVLGGGRPRLFVDRELLCALRASIRHPDSVRHEIFTQLKARVDSDRAELFSAEQLNYGRSYLAASAAFLYLLTGERRYAEQAYRHAAAVIEDESIEGTPTQGYGLARAKTGLSLALVADWAHHGLTEAQRVSLARKLEESLDRWPLYERRRGAAFAPPYAAYWVAVCRGSELLQMLAAGAEDARSERYAQLVSLLRAHVENGFSAAGLGQEGPEYAAAGAAFLLPAALALRERGDTSLAAALATRPLWKALMYLQASGPTSGPTDAMVYGSGQRYGGPHAGFASLAFAFVPPAELPAYRHFYDRHLGRAAGRAAAFRFDADGLGWVWALLSYREDVAPVSPVDRGYGPVLADQTRGTYLFRDRWKDDEDIQAAVFGGLGARPNAWKSPEAFNIGLRAFGTRFFGWAGPAKKERGRLSTLLVDGTSFRDWEEDSGGPTSFQPIERGGLVTVDGGSAYARLGLASAQRQVLVQFSRRQGDGTAAVMATRDRVVGRGSSHRFTWQVNPGGHAGDGGVVVRVFEAAEAASAPAFLLTGAGGAYVKGWAFGPPGLRIVPGDPLQVEVSGSEAEIVVVMAIGRGRPPEARADTSRNQLLITGATSGEELRVSWRGGQLRAGR